MAHTPQLKSVLETARPLPRQAIQDTRREHIHASKRLHQACLALPQPENQRHGKDQQFILLFICLLLIIFANFDSGIFFIVLKLVCESWTFFRGLLPF